MALVLADRVNETTTTSGTGTLTLAGAVSGYQSFSVVGNANTTYYTIVHQTANEWEVGVGTYTSAGTTLSRDTVLASSAGGTTKVTFSAGTKFVFCDYPAGRAVYLDTATNATIPGITLSGGTANGVAYLNGSKVLTTGSALTFDGTTLLSTNFRIASGGSIVDGGGNAVVTPTSGGSVAITSNGAFTNGNIVYNALAASGVHVYSINSVEQMRLTSTGLGIGTSSPGTKLDVNGTARIRAGNTFYFQNAAADANATISASGGSGSSDMAINASGGNVGIGTSSPSVRLDVQGGSINTSSFVTITPTTGTSNAIYRATNTGGTFYAGLDNSAGGVTGTAYSGLLWHTGAYPIAFGTSGTERMRIAAAGNVTINAPSSGESLTVNTISGSGIRATAADLPRVATVSTGANAVTVSMRSYDAGAFGIVGTQSNHALNLRTNDLDRLVIDTSGNVGIGTTSPSYKLDTNSSSAGTIARFVNGVGRGYVRMDGYDDMTLQFYRRGAATGFIQTDSSGAEFIAGTAGAYPFSFYTNNTERMRISSSGNLGIGTSSPSVRLDVQGGSINTSSFVTITPTTGTSNAIYRATNTGGTFYAGLDNSAGGVTGTAYSGLLWHTGAYPIAFGTSGTERMRLDSSGNLGIGVTPSAWYTPDYKAFQLTGGGALYNNGANNFVALSQNMFVNGSLANTYIATAAASRYRQSAGTHIWDIAPSGTAGNAITFTQAMTLDASGNLGVGTTSPSYKLDISGAAAALRLNGGANTYADITDGTNTLRIQINGGDANISSTGAYPIVFNTNGSERARIDSSGNLLVGTTSTYGGPGRINIGFNQSSNFGITLRNTSATATGVFVSFENSGGTGNGSISQTNSTTVAYNTSSDRRLKKAIVPAPSAGSDIDAIEVVSHEWVSNNDVVKYGVVAQDLHKIAPLAVTVGDESDEIERVWGVDYSKLVPMLVKEIQELRARVSQLENK